jgi:hypothetical protein
VYAVKRTKAQRINDETGEVRMSIATKTTAIAVKMYQRSIMPLSMNAPCHPQFA